MVINHLGESLILTLRKPRESGFRVHDIKGLGPVKADIHTSSISTLDGVIYNSAQLGGRNIVLELGFLGAPTIEETRLKSYKCFPIKQNVTLIFETDTRTALTHGYVETNEPTIFGKETGTQISIVC